MRLKNDKAAGTDGVPSELFKTGSNETVGPMHQLIYDCGLARPEATLIGSNQCFDEWLQ